MVAWDIVWQVLMMNNMTVLKLRILGRIKEWEMLDL
jgi:hypothetical protein